MTPEGVADLDESALERMYKTMITITLCDRQALAEARAGALKAATYPVRGLEAVCAAIGVAVRPTDYLVSTYRNLGDVVAKGVPLRQIMAESYGRVGGTSKGMGGPMHLADLSVGLMATSGIVGGGVPIAAGLGLAAQLDGESRVVVTTFGDGATSIGAFHEAMSFASIWKLPVIFVCQNNQWGEHTALADYAAQTDIVKKADGYAMRGVAVDGFDPLATLAEMQRSVAIARRGEGPSLLECRTYRLGAHSGTAEASYVPKDELRAAMERDPTPAFRAWLASTGTIPEETLEAIDRAAAVEVEDAFSFARSCPVPADKDLFENVFGDRSMVPG